MDVKDIEGKQLNIGDKVIVEDYTYIFKGEVFKFCDATLKIKLSSPNNSSFWMRQIGYPFTKSKIYKI